MRARQLGKAPGKPEVGTVRLGVLGCADIAWRRTLPALAGIPEIELAAVASREESKARLFGDRFDAIVVHGYERLLALPDIDAIYIPLPNGQHAEWARRALTAGKHTLVEKPLTPREADTAELIHLAQAHGLKVAENYTFLYHAQHAQVRELLASCAIGELREVRGVFGIPPRDPADIRYQLEQAGGALLDVGVYPLVAAQTFLGNRLKVAGARLRTDPVSGVGVTGGALLEGPGSTLAQIAFGFEHAYRSSHELWGSTGRMVLDHAFTPPEDWRPTLHMTWQDGARDLRLEPDHQFRNSLRAFARTVLEDLDTAAEEAAMVDRARLVHRVAERTGERT